MELRHLRYFVMVAEEGNVSRAAARLNISQPAVSRQLKDLEHELGVALFDRGRNGLRLTEAGNFALAQARELLRQANSLQGSMQAFTQQTKTMTLRIGYIPTALPGFLTRALRQFNADHQHVCVELEEMNPTRQEKALARAEIDVALLGTACPDLAKKYRIETIREVPVVLALPDNHDGAGDTAIDLSEMGAEKFLTLNEAAFPGRPHMQADLFGQAEIDPPVVLKANSLGELLAHVGAGLGIALVPSDVDQLPHPGVVFIPLKNTTHTLKFSAVWDASEQTRELLDLLDALKAD